MLARARVSCQKLWMDAVRVTRNQAGYRGVGKTPHSFAHPEAPDIGCHVVRSRKERVIFFGNDALDLG